MAYQDPAIHNVTSIEADLRICRAGEPTEFACVGLAFAQSGYGAKHPAVLDLFFDREHIPLARALADAINNLGAAADDGVTALAEAAAGGDLGRLNEFLRRNTGVAS